MSQSSTFLTAEPSVTLACRPTPDVVVYYDGSTNDVPTLSATGTILFPGAKANRPSSGIGFNGKDKVFALNYDSIRPGGAGVKQRCVVAATKEKIMFTATAGNADRSTTNLSLQLQVIQSCANPQEYDLENPIYAYYRAGVVDTVSQKLTALAARFNARYAHLGTAVVQTVNGAPYLVLETLNVGERFNVRLFAGLDGPYHVVPGFKGSYQADWIPDWLPGTNAPTDPIKALELFVNKQVETETAGYATSTLTQATKRMDVMPQTISVVCAVNTNGTAALEALKTILRGPASGNLAQKYLAKMVGDDCADALTYDYTIVRTDANTDAAIATLRSDYPAAVFVGRTSYDGTKSTYRITTASATAPTLVGSDVVTTGAK